MPDDDPLLDTAAVADLAGVQPQSIRIYLKRTRARIAAKEPLRPQDFPTQDETYGRSPVWHKSTIERWLSDRPGSGRRDHGQRGVGGHPRAHTLKADEQPEE